MFGCYFRATGDDFDVDLFGSTSSLIPDDVFHRGERIDDKGNVTGKPHQTSGFNIVIGKVFGKLKPQIDDAQKFLEQNQGELLRLVKFPNVTDSRLVFAYCPGTTANVCEYFPPKLISMAGSLGVGIELSVYPGDNSWLSE